jgi:hypothetical protein
MLKVLKHVGLEAMTPVPNEGLAEVPRNTDANLYPRSSLMSVGNPVHWLKIIRGAIEGKVREN